MNYRIIGDSCCDLNEELEEELNISLIPFKIDIDDESFVDDKDLDIEELLKAMKKSPNPIRTSCPSPGDFVEEYKKYDTIFVIAISNQLSGTYNAAVLAKEMIQEEYPDKFIHVFNSKSASSGETLIAIKIDELVNKGLSNEEIVKETEDYIATTKTFFVLESLDNLMKNGRITKAKGLLANVLNIKPIMGSDDDGNIQLIENVRGSKRVFKRLVEKIGEEGENLEEKVLAISHGNALEKAKGLKKEIMDKYNFKDVILVDQGGLSIAYAYEGGIILVF